MRRVREVTARYEQEAGRGGAAVGGLAAVVDVLREGAVEVLLLIDDPSSTDRLWAGEQPLLLGTTEQEVVALGAAGVVQDRADAVLLRAAIGQAAAVKLVAGTELPHGVGALLRFDVRPTPPGRGS